MSYDDAIKEAEAQNQARLAYMDLDDYLSTCTETVQEHELVESVIEQLKKDPREWGSNTKFLSNDTEYLPRVYPPGEKDPGATRMKIRDMIHTYKKCVTI